MKWETTASTEPYSGEVISETMKLIFLTFLTLFLVVIAFLFNSPIDIIQGQWKILTSPANLTTDYFALSNVGATFFNSALMVLHSIIILRITRAKINGPVVAAVFTVAAFAFFGKNLYNSTPIVIGAFAYAKIIKVPAQRSILAAFFGTALGPLVSEISFNFGLPIVLGIGLGYLVGLIVGFILPPLAAHFIGFTKGFSVYNVGFTSGVIGTVFTSIIRALGFEITPVSVLASGYNDVLLPVFVTLFGIMLLSGLAINSWSLKGYGDLLKHSGQLSTDYIELEGFRVTLINMGVLGYVSLLYVLLHGGELNGPVIGGILTVVGFGAFGKHLKNVLPVLIGISLMGMLNQYDMSATGIIIAGLFGTTIAPIAGRYGVLIGIVAGALHLSIVTNTAYLHGGINLYNNGFAGGFVAAFMIPLLEAIQYHSEKRKSLRDPVDPAQEIEVETD